MDRRKFLIGAGGTVIGASALIGSGAFSRVESQRQVSIEVAPDDEAYLGLKTLNTLNSDNFVDYDEDGHIYIDIGEIPDEENEIGGSGVNSDSFTYFDGLFEICNQGKADMEVSYELPDPPEDRDIDDDWEAPADGYDDQVVAFYWIDGDGERHVVEEGDPTPVALGECAEMGLRTVTKGIDATLDEPLIDGEVVVTATSDAGEPQ